MSLQDAKMPRLSNKLEATAEETRNKAEAADIKEAKVIKKASKKN